MIFKGTRYTFTVNEENLRMFLLLVIPYKGQGAISEFLIENAVINTISYPGPISDKVNFEIELRSLVRKILAQSQTAGYVIKLLQRSVLSYESNPLYYLKAMHIFSREWLEHTKIACAKYMVQIFHRKGRFSFYRRYTPSLKKVWVVKNRTQT